MGTLRPVFHQMKGSAMPSIGTHRVENQGQENGVWITSKGVGRQISETLYVANRYWPQLISLSWGSATPFGTVARSRGH